MIRCNKCNIEKEDNQFQKYWHSTQQKHRIRKECSTCFYKQRNERKRLKRLEDKLNKVSIPTEIIQPVVPELEPEVSIDISQDPNYKQCIGCKEWKTKDNFYKFGADSRFNRCKACIKLKDEADREAELIEQGGSLQISPKPNIYKDQYQRKLVFDFLPLLGWIFNEEKGIWHKPGFKNDDGTFVNIKSKPKGLNLKKFNKLSNEDRVEIYRLRKKGYKLEEIATIFGVTKAAICNSIKNYERKI